MARRRMEPERAEVQPMLGETKPVRSGRFAGMSIAGLRLRHEQVVGRPSSSDDVDYLKWRIRQAERGHVPLGPRTALRPAKHPDGYRTLPLRLGATLVAGMDAVWRARGMKSRTAFVLAAICHYLGHIGEADAAALCSARPGAAR